ncbi:Serine/threonine-protein kinase PrkC [Novipirellula galeiformis]|uniref:Serine/threonine-protein kinase PrkC n=1 Tax=Novipirellula galeiformis TaxID=2528004 RepID=A0A5C6CPE9_9BACT|nr:serine/threonine-protein kinase [Novipirellula galeiformis]TWU25271.1 Serine/threonine-protein kinase PrkC [Novipirellula galeiformis]
MRLSPEEMESNDKQKVMLERDAAKLLSEPASVSAEWVEACWDEMRSRCEAGVTFSADNYLSLLQSPSEEVAVDLIYGEYVTRVQAGQSVDTEELLSRHRTYADAISRQLAIEDAIADLDKDDNIPDSKIISLPFENIGRYRLIARIGAGTQAAVFRAHDPNLRRDVVIKLQNPDATGAASEFAAAEAVIRANLEHPALAPVIDTGEVEGRHYIVSRYVDAMTFSQWVTIRRPSRETIADVVSQISTAIGHAHKRGVLHLDIKPDNVLIDASDKPYVIDFGLASMSRSNQSIGDDPDAIRGTLPFMSPEQASGESSRLSSATDVFGIGSLLYLAICGHPPYQGASLADLADIQACRWDHQSLADAGSSTRLQAIAKQAMSADPANRFRDAESLADELRKIATPQRKSLSLFPWGSGGAIAASMIALFFILPRPEPLSTTPIAPLSVLVQSDGGDFLPIQEAGSEVRTGDKIRIVGAVPTGQAAVLFNIAPTGELQVLSEHEKDRSDAWISYPSQDTLSLPLEGAPGTEIVGLAIGEDCVVIRAILNDNFSANPIIPLPTIVSSFRKRYDSDWSVRPGSNASIAQAGIPGLDQLAGETRAIGLPVTTDRNIDVVQAHLSELISNLQQSKITIEIIAFPHGNK